MRRPCRRPPRRKKWVHFAHLSSTAVQFNRALCLLPAGCVCCQSGWRSIRSCMPSVLTYPRIVPQVIASPYPRRASVRGSGAYSPATCRCQGFGCPPDQGVTRSGSMPRRPAGPCSAPATSQGGRARPGWQSDAGSGCRRYHIRPDADRSHPLPFGRGHGAVIDPARLGSAWVSRRAQVSSRPRSRQ